MRNKEEKNIKNKRKHKKGLRVLVYIVLITIVLSILLLIAYGVYYFSTSSKFVLKGVEFKGNNVYVYEELVEAANIDTTSDTSHMSKKSIEENLKQLPYIKDVKIKTKLPDKYVITITEFVSNYLAYNKEKNEYIRLTKDGIILENVDSQNKINEELLVFGLSFDDKINLKQKIARTEIEKLEKLEKMIEYYGKSKIDKKITSVEFKDENVILTLDYDINVILNENNLDYNMSFLRSILDNIIGKAGTIDMTKTNPVFTESIK